MLLLLLLLLLLHNLHLRRVSLSAASCGDLVRMENQGVASAPQLSQEVDDERLGRRVFNPFQA